jgi:HlyD family secretion protein
VKWRTFFSPSFFTFSLPKNYRSTMPGLKITFSRFLTVVVIVAGLALGFWHYRKEGQPDLRYETVKVERGRIVAKVTASGTLSALVTVQVGSQVSGRIQQIFVDFNSKVKKGEIIAKIDPRLFEASVAQARANYVTAQGNLAKAKAQAVDADRQYRRARALAERQLIAQAEADTAEANAESAQAQIEVAQGGLAQAKAGLQQAEVNLAYTDIISPTNGVIISRNVDVGQTVAASLQAPILFLLAEDLSKMQVDTSVAEADIGKLRDGMAASFTVDAYAGERFTGRVRQIRNAAQAVQNVVTYDAVVDVSNADLKLRPGMTATVTFIYAEQEEVLRIPNAALRFRPPQELLERRRQERREKNKEGAREKTELTGRADAATSLDASWSSSSGREGTDRRTVWVLRGETPEAVRVKVGISDGTVSEVAEGNLQADEQVIVDVSGGTETPRTNAPGGGLGGPGGFRRLF